MSPLIERGHALLSPSSSYRWLICTPSARKEEQMPEIQTPYSQEGTLAHEAAKALLCGVHAEGEADPIMKRYVQGYADYVRSMTDAGRRPIVESEVRLDKWAPKSFGTPDCIIPGKDVLTVVDFKYGMGHRVSASNNPQLMMYALGACGMLEALQEFKLVRLCIYQPRIGNVDEWEISVQDLLTWGENVLKPKASLAWKGQGELKAGEHCAYCSYSPLCPAIARYSLEHCSLGPSSLTPSQVAEVLKRDKSITSWLEGVKRYAVAVLQKDPQGIPGFKLTLTPGRRKISDEELAKSALLKAGYSLDEFMPRKMKTLSALRDLAGAHVYDLLSGAITRGEGTPKAVPIEDKGTRL